MTSETDLKIRDQLIQYLDEKISLREFEDWFVPVAWDITQNANKATIEIVGEIELRLAEFSNGHWTEAELRTKLELLASFYRTEIVLEQSQASDDYSFEGSFV